MTISITLPADLENALRAEADHQYLTIEAVAARHLQEAHLLRRIFAYLPPEETRRMRSLVRKRMSDTLTTDEADQVARLAEERERRNALRMADLLTLSQLRGTSLRQTMIQLGIRPQRMG